MTMQITVLAGGPGAEREVSLRSGRAVYEALLRMGHQAVLCDVDPDDLSALDADADLVFIALHGEFGEDGTIQSELEARGLCYSGSDAAASRLAMNKVHSKRCFEAAGILTPPYVVSAGQYPRTETSPTPPFPLPAIVKPVASGSSVDVTIARTPDALTCAAAKLVEEYGQALVEKYIDGPELTVGIVGNRALPVCEIRTRRDFYDYDAKYLDDDTQYLFDLDLPTKLLQRVQDMSLTAHHCLGCSAFSRVDWMVDGATLEPFILEINTIPGFTNHSLLPKAAARIGWSFTELCQRIMDLALEPAATPLYSSLPRGDKGASPSKSAMAIR